MDNKKALYRMAAACMFAGASSVVLSGCFAMQQDLDPIRSDISVLEKQFMEVQRDCARAKVAAEEANTAQTAARLDAIEKRLDALEAKPGGSTETPAEMTAPQPMPPEPPAGAEGQPQAAAVPEGAAPSAPQPTGAMAEAEAVFGGAQKAYLNGDTAKAEAGFRDFLARFPNDRLADDAGFYLGEIAFSKKDYKGAIAEYEKVVREHPLADRVPDALFRAGAASEELGDADGARRYYTRVLDNYPYSEAAKKARQKLESGGQ